MGIYVQPSTTYASSTTIFVCFLIIILSGAFLCWIDVNSVITGGLLHGTSLIFTTNSTTPINYQNKTEFPLNCSNNTNVTQSCPTNYPSKFVPSNLSATECPEYFRWIHEDLQPWKNTGITRDMIERLKEYAHFRLVIVNGKLYVEKYKRSYQTRDVFTIWGIVQLLRLYPGEVPDLELMFWCEDRPTVEKRHHQGPNATSPPPLFVYSGTDQTLDIVFPDWSFWGWAEVNIKPWESIVNKIKEGSEKMKWKERVPYAYWKGNPRVAPTRRDLMKCNFSNTTFDWNARLYVQDWIRESKQGFKNSKLEDQCTHRYKIYIEGNAWSVSEKYILACDSMTLFVKPMYYDFFTRSLQPLHHYWPIRPTNKCRDIKFAVEWGNNHTTKAQAIGEEGSRFTQEQLKMGFVYDYMLHLLREYAKLLKFKPEIPTEAMEVCAETMACHEKGILIKEYMEESMVKSPSDTVPCTMPPRYDPIELQQFLQRQENITGQVEMWESEYWKTINKTQ